MSEPLVEGMAPGAGLGPPAGAEDYVPPQPEAEPEPAPDLAAQMEQLQQTIEQQQQMLQRVAPLVEYIDAAPGQAPEQEQQGTPEIDLFSDDPTEQIRRLIREETAPYAEVVKEKRNEELQARALDMISSIETEKGELLRPQFAEGQEGLDPRELVLQIAVGYSPAMDAQYGPGLRSDEAALEQAYEEVKSTIDGWIAAAQAREANQVATLSAAAREPGSSGIPAQPVVTTVPGGWDAFKSRHGF